MGTPRDDDAQRELERKALRNVRGLVDKIQDEDRKGNQKQLAAVIVVVALVAALAAAFLVGRSREADKGAKPAIEIPPMKPVAK
jgi:uncharacterized membrane protein